MYKPVVAIVGRPNVGKSTFFNKICGKRISIVDDTPGVTRDRIYADGEWSGHAFTLVDTGGLDSTSDDKFQNDIKKQAQIAIQEADVIVFMVDGRVGVTANDEEVATILHRSKKPVVLVVNKLDRFEVENTYDFYSLALGQPYPLSVMQSKGIGDILDAIVSYFKDNSTNEESKYCKVAIVGRPNVGKSSIVNKLIGNERVVVSDIEGTTRDSIDTSFIKDGTRYVAIDTAGLKKRGQIYESVDKYASMRALRAIERSEVIVFVIDAHAGLKEQDKHVVGYAIENNKAIVIVVNKWDLMDKTPTLQDEFKKQLKKEMPFLDYSPIIFVSALNKTKINKVFEAIHFVYNAYHLRIATNVLNEVIQDAQTMNESPNFNGGRLKIYYANQVDVAPPTFVLFVNEPKWMHFSYQRYLENRLRDTFNFDGTPIKFVLRKRI